MRILKFFSSQKLSCAKRTKNWNFYCTTNPFSLQPA